MIFKIIGIALISVIAILFCDSVESKVTVLISVTAILTISFMVVGNIKEIIEYFNNLCGRYGYEEYYIILLKALGIGIITNISTEICNEFGQYRISKSIEFAGKIELLLISFPLIKKILELSEGILIG